jgi:hypothetical protein
MLMSSSAALTDEEERSSMETTRAGYQQQMERQLAKWSARLEGLKARAAVAGVGTKAELLTELGKLEKLEVAGRQHLAAVATAAEARWGEVRAGLIDKWNHVNGALDAIWARVREP